MLGDDRAIQLTLKKVEYMPTASRAIRIRVIRIYNS
jgi:hypothetical protein